MKPSALASLALSSLLVLSGCESDPAASAPPVAKEIAQAAGLDAFSKVTELRYTFHVNLGGDKPEISRSWTWKPKMDEVTMTKPGEEPVTYLRSELEGASEAVIAADKAFINDQYWLIFPFHLVWDEGVTITESSGKSPIDGVDCRIVDVQYGSGMGYTPGDLYKLSVDDSGKVFEWAFHPGGAAEAARVTRWTDYEDKGGLQISMNRESGGEFKVWFTDVTVATE